MSLNASLVTLKAGLTPAFKQTFTDGTEHFGFRVGSGKKVQGERQDPLTGKWMSTEPDPDRPGKFRDILVPKIGYQRRRQIGQGHSQAERQARREEKRQRGNDYKAYAKWFDSLTPAEKAFARAHKINRPMPAAGFKTSGEAKDALDAVDVDAEIPAAEPRGAHNGDALFHGTNAILDELEPIGASVELESLTAEEASEASETFGDALRWALAGNKSAGDEVHELVDLGRRAAVLIAGMRTDLSVGLHLDPSLARQFIVSFGGRFHDTLDQLQAAGRVYGRILVWLRGGATLSDLGERLQQVAYFLCPGLLDGATAAELGKPTNKTRQAVNKLTQQIRDMFAGFVTRTMRGDETRRRCQAAQLNLRPATA